MNKDELYRPSQEEINYLISLVAQRPERPVIWQSTQRGRNAVEELRQYMSEKKRERQRFQMSCDK